MEILKKNVKIKTSVIIIACLVFAVILIGILLWGGRVNDTNILSTILGSLFAGLIVAIIQFVIAWQDYRQTEKLKKLELLEVLYTRSNRTFYENYIKQAKQEINMMGVTASRFFNDFADDDPNATANAKVLLDALRRDVNVKILLPDSEFVDESKRQEIEKVKQLVANIKSKYQGYQLEVRYFKHIATHSIFNVDDKSIVGPVFPELESKYTPALYLRNSSPLAFKYLSYFKNEWKKAE